MTDLTFERAKELFEYSPDTGILRSRVRRGCLMVGGVAGSKHGQGYLKVGADRRYYLSHRIIWLLTHGSFPADEIDHINGIRDDNRLVNLRAVTRAENVLNQRLYPTNTSGFCGVSWDSARRKWIAWVRVGGKSKYLGGFTEKEVAIAARKAANLQYGFHPNHGKRLEE